ncbi:MAG: redoxin domain-containing protein [Sedimentisphaerales bacterium]|nr:redoxin domain-containing protein [Sedimentisphaerales bacterium]
MNKKCFVSTILLLLSATIGEGMAQKDLGTEDLNIYRKEGLKHFLHSDSIPEDFIKEPNKMAPDSLITVRTIDRQGRPVPFCRIVFVDRDEKTTRSFHETATNENGYAYYDALGETFSINAHLYEYNPVTKASRSQHKKIGQLYNAHDNKIVTVEWEPFPAGTGKIEGRVSDQYGKSLTKFELTLNYLQGVRTDWSESYETYQSIEVNNSQGRYELAGLASRTYSYMLRAEDYAAYVWDFDMGSFTIPEEPNAMARLDIEVEAKELFYGRALYKDGSPIYPAFYELLFPTTEQLWPTEEDGSFRVALTKRDLQDFMETTEGKINIIASQNNKRVKTGEVNIKQLSKDLNNFTKFEFEKIEIPVETKTPDTEAISQNKVTFTPTVNLSDAPSLKGKVLPELEVFKITLSPKDTKDKMLIVCFFDFNQRPSRNCILQLSKKTQELKEKGIIICAVQASEIEQEKLDEWIKENNISFPVGMIPENIDTLKSRWGVKSLPWLILTDKEHIVIDEGFNISDIGNF